MVDYLTMNVNYTAQAQAFLDKKHDDPSLEGRLNKALDEFEADPTHVSWRTKAYGTVKPRVWAFHVPGVHDTVMVLWQQISPATDATPKSTDDFILVSYIGPII